MRSCVVFLGGDVMGQAFSFLWHWGFEFLSFRLDFGDISFTLLDFCLGVIVVSMIIALVRRIFE